MRINVVFCVGDFWSCILNHYEIYINYFNLLCANIELFYTDFNWAE